MLETNTLYIDWASQSHVAGRDFRGNPELELKAGGLHIPGGGICGAFAPHKATLLEPALSEAEGWVFMTFRRCMVLIWHASNIPKCVLQQ